MMKRITEGMLDELTGLFVDVFNSPPWNDLWSVEQARIRLHDIMKRPKFFGIADYRDNRLVGMIMGHGEQSFDGIHFQILELCIANDMKGQGIGSDMLTELTKYLESRGVASIYLLTMRGVNTEGFYIEHGFKTSQQMCIMSKHYEKR